MSFDACESRILIHSVPLSSVGITVDEDQKHRNSLIFSHLDNNCPFILYNNKLQEEKERFFDVMGIHFFELRFETETLHTIFLLGL